MTTTIQQTETYRQVMAWLRGGDATPDPQMENSFLDIMTAAVAERFIANRQEYERMARAAERAQRRAGRPAGCLSIKAMLEEVRSENQIKIETVLADDEDLPEAEPVKAGLMQVTVTETPEASSVELDSVLLAKALRHMAVIEGIELTQSQIQTILYLKTGHPNIFRYLENCFRRYAWTKACILTAPHLSEGSPWSDTRRSNPDRWGVRIEDELIREWFLPRV